MQRIVAARVITFMFVLIALSLSTNIAQAIDIAQVGSWSRTVDANDLSAGVGTDLNSTYESNSNQGLVTISGATGSGDNWRVDVNRSDVFWHDSLSLSVKRTGNGTGSGSISGGTNYQAVSTTTGAFFSGGGDRSDIPIQLQISGASVTIPPATYSTTITYTVVDTQ